MKPIVTLSKPNSLLICGAAVGMLMRSRQVMRCIAPIDGKIYRRPREGRSPGVSAMSFTPPFAVFYCPEMLTTCPVAAAAASAGAAAAP